VLFRSKVQAWEEAFHRFMDAAHPEVGRSIVTEKALSAEAEEKLKAAIVEFKQTATY